MPVMESVTLENFRCFRERQTVRLAPLTLLVGENSTGKTSFLALIRVLAQLQLGSVAPDFKEPPYDLGSFDDIAYFRSGGTRRADSFTIGFAYDEPVEFAGILPLTQRGAYTFRKRSAAPELVRRSVCDGSHGVDEECIDAGSYRITLKVPSRSWTLAAEESPYDYHLAITATSCLECVWKPKESQMKRPERCVWSRIKVLLDGPTTTNAGSSAWR